MTTLKDYIEGDDLDVFLNSDEFAVEATFTGSFGPYTVKGIFEEKVSFVNDYTGGAQSSDSTLQVKTEDFEKAVNHDTVKIGGKTYEILSVEPEGTGLTALALNRIRED